MHKCFKKGDKYEATVHQRVNCYNVSLNTGRNGNDMKVNIKQISEQTGFSPATVSNALNHKRGVNKETAETIFKVAKELGYITDIGITKVKFILYRRNGQILDDTPFFTQMINGAERACMDAGYEMMMVHVDRFSPDYEEQVETLINDSSSALVLLGTEVIGEDLKPFHDSKCPIITLDYCTGDMKFSGVAINNEDSFFLATKYLIDQGHTDIGYLSGKFRIRAFRLRNRGYQKAMNTAGLSIKPEFRVPLSTSMDSAYQDMMAYLKTSPKLPTAYIADNDMIALGALRALQEHRIRIPEDVSIIGFDDLPYSEICSPRLTSIRVPKQEMGKLAIEKLISILNNGDAIKTKIEVSTEFIIRDSVRKLK